MTSGILEGSRDGVETPRGLRGKAAAAWIRMARARRARRDFQALAAASDHYLADIGLTRADVDRVLAAPFWVDPIDVLRRRGAERRHLAIR